MVCTGARNRPTATDSEWPVPHSGDAKKNSSLPRV
jgi:hypothetical protein